MKIEGYEPFHIGIKLIPAVGLPQFKDKIKAALKKRKYAVVTQETQNNVLLQSEKLGTKKDVSVDLNHTANALNSSGKTPKNVIATFKELLDILKHGGYDIKASASFFEIIANITIKTDKKPVDILHSACTLDVSSLKRIRDLKIEGIKIGNSIRNDPNEFFGMAIEPKSTNPNERLNVNILFRSKDQNEIIGYEDKIGKHIYALIKQLEAKK